MVSQIGAVERQIAEVRRRRNLFAAQQVVYVPLAIAGGLLALLVALAFLIPAPTYMFAVWGAIVVFAIGTARAFRRLRASWLGADAPRAIDRAAGLEERLTTLAAFSPKRVESRLWGHLVADNLRLLARWTPQTLTPRRVPRSVWPALAGVLVIVALALLAAASGADDGEFFPRPSAHADGSEEGPGALSFEATDEGAGGALVDWSELLAAMPERLREEILRRAKRAAPGTEPPPGARPVGRKKGGGASGAGADSKSGADPGKGEQIARDATGAGGEGKSPGQELARREQPPGARGAPRDSQPPAKGDGLKVLGQRQKGQEAGGSAGGGPGAGGGTAAGGLYGAPPESEGRPSGLFALDLDAERGEGGEDGDGEPGSRPASPLSSEQRIDDAVRRAQVPADYEKIVQRLFQRGEGAETGR